MRLVRDICNITVGFRNMFFVPFGHTAIDSPIGNDQMQFEALSQLAGALFLKKWEYLS